MLAARAACDRQSIPARESQQRLSPGHGAAIKINTRTMASNSGAAERSVAHDRLKQTPGGSQRRRRLTLEDRAAKYWENTDDTDEHDEHG